MSEEKNNPSATNIKVTKDTDTWEVVVKAEIPATTLAKYKDESLKEIQRDATLAGFRKGHAPESEIIRVYGEATVLRQAAERAIQHALPEILAKENLPVIETPRVTTEAPESGKPLVFTARAALAPRIELPDYKALAKKHLAPKEEIVVSDEEHEHAMTHLRRERARIEKVEAGKAPAEAAEESRKMQEKDLPVLDDEFAKSIGYESIAHFNTIVRNNMKAEKVRQVADVRRQTILEELSKETKASYPAILREYELDDMEARLKDDLTRRSTTLDAYLAQIKKTREELRKEWKDAADKRAKIRLILTEIGRKENIEPDEEALKGEVEQAKKLYPQADRETLRAHIAHAMRNEAVLKFLESS